MYRYFVTCPQCRVPFEVREVQPYDIREDVMGEDVVTFICPRCPTNNMPVESPVRSDP